MRTNMVIGIIQARTGSTRLPAKVLRPLAGKPMLLQELLRVKAAKRLDAITVATTDKPEDAVIETLATEAGVGCFRGSEADVLDRFYKAAVAAGAKAGDVVVRITGDCPLQVPQVIDSVIAHFVEAGVEYTSTPANYPEGLDTEAFTFEALETAWKEAKLPSEREHVTPYIKKVFHSDVWEEGSEDNRTMHWSVDTEADFQFVEQVYEALYHEGEVFHLNDILAYVHEHPELLEINKSGTGYEGLEKSLKEDERFLTNDL